jgi:hypothetical protein
MKETVPDQRNTLIGRHPGTTARRRMVAIDAPRNANHSFDIETIADNFQRR